MNILGIVNKIYLSYVQSLHMYIFLGFHNRYIYKIKNCWTFERLPSDRVIIPSKTPKIILFLLVCRRPAG